MGGETCGMLAVHRQDFTRTRFYHSVGSRKNIHIRDWGRSPHFRTYFFTHTSADLARAAASVTTSLRMESPFLIGNCPSAHSTAANTENASIGVVFVSVDGTTAVLPIESLESKIRQEFIDDSIEFELLQRGRHQLLGVGQLLLVHLNHSLAQVNDG